MYDYFWMCLKCFNDIQRTANMCWYKILNKVVKGRRVGRKAWRQELAKAIPLKLAREVGGRKGSMKNISQTTDVKPTFFNKQNLVLIQYWYNMMNENKCKPFSHVFFCLQVALPIVSCFWSPPSIPRCPKYVHHLGLRSGKLSASAMSMPMCGFSVDSTLEMHRNA